jgi:hypothetical protein
MTSDSDERYKPAESPSQIPTAAQEVLTDYFRCPSEFATFRTAREVSSEEGYFAFGDAVAYGRRARGPVRPSPVRPLDDAARDVVASKQGLELPFDLSEVVTNLRQERYSKSSPGYIEGLTASGASQGIYYALRPLLPVPIRRHLQRIRLSGWDQIAFPRWPVDTSVDTLMRKTLALLLQHRGVASVPFIWFWPDGAPCSAVMTHDVEGPVGRDFSEDLMDLDDASGIKSAFQLVPEVRGDTTSGLVERIRARGFEVNLHDLNHDGYLFHNKPQFLERAAQINRYTHAIGCDGFRSGAMYRNQEWFEAFEFSYDMSVPNVAHLEPQRGGCCTVMPYFVGKILELPLTTTQDYSLFHILGEYSIALWKQQIELIRAMNGFISFIAHPDYLVEPRAQAVYSSLLAHLQQLRDAGQVWLALPGDVNRWWRHRRQMTLVPHGRSWTIAGPDSHRARVAFATLDGDRVVYTLQN